MGDRPSSRGWEIYALTISKPRALASVSNDFDSRRGSTCSRSLHRMYPGFIWLDRVIVGELEIEYD